MTPDDRANEYDSIEERYRKNKFVCERCIIYQIGICCFKWDQGDQTYYAKPYNFYVMSNPNLADTVFYVDMNQTVTLALEKYNWTDLFENGIP